jgi:hypothetical protein
VSTIVIDSLILGSRVKVEIDPYATNVLAEDCRQASTAAYKVALAKAGPPPKMFTDGTADLPAFTAAGFDPDRLLRLPALARHYVAAVADPSTVHQLFEQLAADPSAYIHHPGLTEAVVRVRDWASGGMDRDRDQPSWLRT